jgi:hypothetical protein
MEKTSKISIFRSVKFSNSKNITLGIIIFVAYVEKVERKFWKLAFFHVKILIGEKIIYNYLNRKFIKLKKKLESLLLRGNILKLLKLES